MDEPKRSRARSALVSAAAVVTVVAVIGVTNVLTSSGTGSSFVTPDPPPPAVTRLVGFGRAAIAVPKVWGTNFSRCGTPRKDTVLIDDPSAASDCQVRRPPKVDSVELKSTPTTDFQADHTFTIDGVQAERQETICDAGVCWGAVGIPSHHVWFRAESSTNADEVDWILAQVEIVADRTGVPSYQRLGRRPAGTAYAKVLEREGLKATFKTRSSSIYPPGMVVGVSPAPGSLLKLGSTVTVTVVG